MASTPISVSKLTDTPWRACLFAGLLLLILAATGTVFNTSLRLEYPELLYPIFGIGALLTFVPAVVVFLEARRSEPIGTIDKKAIAKEYAVTVESPREQEVTTPVVVSGTLKKSCPAICTYGSSTTVRKTVLSPSGLTPKRFLLTENGRSVMSHGNLRI